MDSDLEATARQSRAAWRALGLRLQSVTPSQLARALLALAAVSVLIGLVRAAWSDLLPFQLGLVLAYITLPVVNWLDRFMPRWIAASLLVLLEIGAILAFLALLVPPLIDEVSTLLQSLPDVTRVQAWLLSIRAAFQTLPPGVQDLLRNALEQIATNVRTNGLTYVQAGLQVALGTALGVFGTLGFAIGFLGIPTWLVSVMSDHQAGIRAVNRVLPRDVQPDFWAVMRILDRTFSAFVRGQLLYAVVTAFAIYAGFVVLDRLNLSAGQFRLILALIAGVTQLIPAIGPILGAIPAVAVGLAESPEAAFATLAMYVGVQFLLSTFVGPLVADRYIDIHPAIFVILLVVLSQFGLFWVLVAAPLSIVLRDLFVYAYGRLSDPPKPAGVAPGEQRPVAVMRRQLRAGSEVARG